MLEYYQRRSTMTVTTTISTIAWGAFVGIPVDVSSPARWGSHKICGRSLHWHTARMNMDTEADEEGKSLLIVGAGVLGRLIANEWQKTNPHAMVIGETRTTDHHDELASIGIQPALAGSTDSTPPYVAFCAPPSGASDYASTVHEAVSRAAAHGSRFVFTSSTSVYGDTTVTDINENTPTVSVEDLDKENAVETPKGERARTLVTAENSVLSYENGLVVRLSGLYTNSRGAHSYWLRAGTVKGFAKGKLNLVHYEDAARAVVQALTISSDELSKWSKRPFLAVALESVSREDMCNCALKHPLFKDYQFPQFADPDNTTASRVERTFNNDWTRRVLQWTPQWKSFAEFMKEDARICEQRQ